MKSTNFVLAGAFILISTTSPLYAAEGLSDIFGGIVDSVKNVAQTVGKQTGESNVKSDEYESPTDGFKYKRIEWWDGHEYGVLWNKKLNQYFCPSTNGFVTYFSHPNIKLDESDAIARGIPSSNGKDCHEDAGLLDPNRSQPLNKQVNKNYKEIDLTDLKSEINSLNGKKISVVGIISSVGDPFTFMGTSKLDKSKVMILIDKLSKEDRKTLFTKCSEGCDLRVNGTVKVRQGDGNVQAEHISVN